MFKEAYNIPYSGYVVVNDEGGFFAKEFLDGGKQIWTDNPAEAAIARQESKAMEIRKWCYNYYTTADGRNTADFYIRYLSSDKEEEQQQMLKYIPDYLDAYANFVFAATEFQKLARAHDFEDNLYTNKDYDNKKQVQPLVLYILNDHNRVSDTLNKFAQAVLKASGLEQNAKEFTTKFDKFVNSWKALVAEKNKIPNSFITAIVDHLKSIDKNKKESYKDANPFSLVKEIEEYDNMWN